MIVSTEKVKKIIEHYGSQHQLYKCAEELSELQMLLLQEANESGKIDPYNIAEELADCYVTLKQVEMIFSFDDRDLQPFADYKLTRTLRGIEK